MAEDLANATVFYSWESDLPAKTTRNLIEGCLNKAIQQLGRDDDVDVDPSLDRDTRGVSGSPVILDAILEKIDNCSAFVADVSIINSGDSSRPTPNPNVAIELGYAVKACGWDRILPVCNEYFGAIDKLPFDIPDRRVIPFTLSENPTPEEITAAKEKLTAIFKLRLKEILKLSRESILDIHVGDPDTEELFGHEHNCRLVRCVFSDYPDGKFPLYEQYSSAGPGLQLREPGANSNYYRDVAEYTIQRNLTHRFAFAVLNRSDKTLLSPRLEVVIESPESELLAFDADSFPDVPDKSIFRGGLPALLERQNRRNVAQLKQGADRTIIRAELENIQAKRTAWSTCVYLGTSADRLVLKCRLYADNLKQPFEQQLTLNFSIAEQSKTLKEWIAAGFTAT
ncbi:MAG: hypothetical protein JNJ77_02030 [Planctomycetia bacterium]|nr:hypothetical protein [Planctomycetia bacterium]